MNSMGSGKEHTPISNPKHQTPSGWLLRSDDKDSTLFCSRYEVSYTESLHSDNFQDGSGSSH